MTRKQAKELLPIIQAFAEGKEVEIKTKECSEWSTLKEDDIQYINFEKYNFRIKPKYRPFKNKEECWQEMQKHKPFGWITDGPRICNIICIREDGILANTNLNGTFYEFESSINLNFADGTPFGIMEN